MARVEQAFHAYTKAVETEFERCVARSPDEGVRVKKSQEFW